MTFQLFSVLMKAYMCGVTIQINHPPGGGGGSLGISGWECAAETLEPLTYTRASSAKFCDPLLV